MINQILTAKADAMQKGPKSKLEMKVKQTKQDPVATCRGSLQMEIAQVVNIKVQHECLFVS